MAVSWDEEHINTKVRRNGTSWGEIQGFISDPTLSGKQKRRMAYSMAKRQFQVSFIFTFLEYQYFRQWYINGIKYGTLSFSFPKIDGTGYEEYRIAEGGTPQYTNMSGKLVECNMTWEEM